jgi:hypothetical protein
MLYDVDTQCILKMACYKMKSYVITNCYWLPLGTMKRKSTDVENISTNDLRDSFISILWLSYRSSAGYFGEFR